MPLIDSFGVQVSTVQSGYKTMYRVDYFTCFCLLSLLISPLMAGEEVGRATPTTVVSASAFDPSVSQLRSLIQHYQADQEALERRHAAALPKVKAERLQGLAREVEQELMAIPFDSLDLNSRIDALLLASRLQFDQQELDREQGQQDEMQPWIPFRQSLAALINLDRGAPHVDAPSTARELARLGEEIAQVSKHLDARLKERKENAAAPHDKEVPSKVLGNRVAKTIEQLRESLRDWNGFYAGYDPEFTWWMRQPFERCEKHLTDFANLIRREVIGSKEGEDAPMIGDPIGRRGLVDALAAEMIPYSPEEIIRIGEEEFKWCEREWKRAAQDLGFGDDWKKAIDHVASLHVQPGYQPHLIRELADEAVKFLEDRNLVTIPPLCREVWRMEMMSPERQKVNPYFTGGEVISISFPTDTMTHED